MRIKRLFLKNFGLYRGDQVLDLAPRSNRGQQRPVVLVGGHNGAGKTTLLEALRTCLHGRLALGERVRESDYHAYLRRQVHRQGTEPAQASSASVGVEFDYARNGARSTFLVERSWQCRPSGAVQESLNVLCNGEPLKEVESEFWPDFVRTLVPPGLSQLFFFDGEKIQRLAEEDTEAETLAESVKALLGLDLVERLRADLDIYASRTVRAGAGVVGTRLREIEARLAELGARRAALLQSQAQAQAQVDYLASQIGKAEQRLTQSGSGLATRRAELQVQKTELSARISELERALRELCEGPFVFSICSDLCDRALAQLEREDRAARLRASQAEVLRGIELVAKRLGAPQVRKKLGLERVARDQIVREIATLKEEVRCRAGGAGVTTVHDVSEHERKRLRDALGQGQAGVGRRARTIAVELEKLSGRVREVQGRINAAPSEEELGPIVRELSVLQERGAKLSAQAAQGSAERDALEIQLAAAERERRRLLENQDEDDKARTRLALATKARTALADYLNHLTAAKIARLEQEAVACFAQLCRKDDLVRRMSIDARTFKVTLFGPLREVHKAELSAGEKQLYAVALLWALARVSGRPLPMIIDTPLGRLDSIHRKNLITRYFPCASHQVVILSTDTEVDRMCFEELRPHTSHSLCLVNHREGWTEAQPGYFWEGDSLVAATA